jgi:hypothetical protein
MKQTSKKERKEKNKVKKITHTLRSQCIAHIFAGIVVVLLFADIAILSLAPLARAEGEVGAIITRDSTGSGKHLEAGPGGAWVGGKVRVPTCNYVRFVNNLDRDLTAKVYIDGILVYSRFVPAGTAENLHVGTDIPTNNDYELQDPPEIIILNSVATVTGNVSYFFLPTVGGVVVPVDKFGLLAPYIGLASTVLVATCATVIYVNHVKRRKENQ